MNETSESDYLENIEILLDYLNFYSDLLIQVFNFDFESKDVLKQIKSVKFDAFSKEESTRIIKSDIKYDEEVTRCAYLLKYSVLSSYCVSEHFSSIYNCDSILFNQLKEMNTARICCFGGGAGTELLAISDVIYKFLKSSCNDEHQYSIKLYFTIIDVYGEWEDWVFALVKNLRKYDKNVIDVRMRFIQADLTENWGEDVLKAIKKADIVTMVKFISALNLNELDYGKKKDLQMLEKVAHEMKLDSWIFFLDFAGGGFYKKMRNRMKRYQYFQQVQSLLYQNHTINKEQLNISQLFLPFLFQVMGKQSSTTVSSGTWQKCIPKMKIKRKKPNSVKNIPATQKGASATSILEEQMDGLLLKEVLKVKEEELDDYYEVPESREDPLKVKVIETKNQNKVKEILKKSGIYTKAKIKNSR